MVSNDTETRVILLVEKLDAMIPYFLEMKNDIDKIIIEIKHVKANALKKSKQVKRNIILTTTLRYYDVSLQQIRSPSRKTHIKTARHVLGALLLIHAGMSHRDIGDIINRDHSMIPHIRKVLYNARDTGDSLYIDYKAIEKQIDHLFIDLDQPISERQSEEQVQ